MCKNATQVLQWCSVAMNKKIRNKRRHMGTKVEIQTKKNIALRKEQLKKQIIDNRSSVEQKKIEKMMTNLISWKKN